MKLCKKLAISVMFLINLFIISGCLAQQPQQSEVNNFADPLTENILLAMNEDNYPRFSRDFDEKMKSEFNETQFKNTIPVIKSKIGNYVSKEFMSVENQSGYTVVTYKAKFTQEPGDVIVRSVFSDINGQKYISGFWLDSPKLRSN